MPFNSLLARSLVRPESLFPVAIQARSMLQHDGAAHAALQLLDAKLHIDALSEVVLRL